ncbi:subunit P of phosphatidylinositol N-acetylglucosaminyltransferase [Drechslerella dactyloides]|uniref:Subunit P of phosphatidylinositol N-acetylglucosaminyltransferase n=1 Tax=Drechslerella dactyloides TaxID=74499 RepID=A0AAD6NHZ5_DREDA|nr:subunit P of phosphatidylinositol N-acetylglucosaminyltransferase [Drechslerella dactyloides]
MSAILRAQEDVTSGPSEAAWEAAKRHIYRIYIEEARTLKSLVQIMSAEHNFKASKKGRPSGQTPTAPTVGRRTRPKRLISQKPNTRMVPVACLVPTLSAIVPRLPDKYRNVEGAMYYTDSHIYALLNTFRWDRFKIITPSGVNAPDITLKWQHLSDQCFGATELIKSGFPDEGWKELGKIFKELQEILKFCDPAMMVKFWRICHRLHEGPWPQSPGGVDVLSSFLRYVSSLVEIYHGKDHPLFKLLDAIVRAPQDQVIDTLKVLYRRTIKAMGSRVGQDHAIVLHMESNYLKYWAKEAPPRSLFAQDFRGLLGAAEQEFGPTGDTTIVVLHEFLYMAYYNLKDKNLTTELALELCRRVKTMPCLQAKPWWCLPTQGFSLAAKILAFNSLEANKREDCRIYLEDAIIRLGTGDKECRTRAMMLADRLYGLLNEWGDHDDAAMWGIWGAGLVADQPCLVDETVGTRDQPLSA